VNPLPIGGEEVKERKNCPPPLLKEAKNRLIEVVVVV
jgi:hypothetical protein